MGRFGRDFIFLGIFALFWITTTPFTDLRSGDVLLAQETGNAAHQIAVLLMLAMSFLLLWPQRKVAMSAISAALICVLLWQLVTVIISAHPDLSIRRYILNVSVIVVTLAWVLAPEDTTHFRRLLRGGSAFVLGLAYFGVLVWPQVSIHNLNEVTELINAGSWRGHFSHKNVAGPAMVVLTLYWLYLAETTQKGTAKAIYWILALLSLNFLYHTNNKTSIGLLMIMFGLAAIIRRSRSLWLQMIVAYTPAGLMALLTLGSVIFEPMKQLVTALVSDPTFTNRTEIWNFALSQLQHRLLTGFGFEAFWATSDLRSGFHETWAATAGHAHNGYLNVAMSSGLIGVFLTIWLIVINPLRDFNRSQKTDNDPFLGLLFLRIWLFMLLYANLESPFFVGRGQVWFSLLGAMFGLRLHARMQQLAAPAPSGNERLPDRPANRVPGLPERAAAK
ncbi:O-antigen ligase family protein [Phyllobacterium salinisoli]|uniref:O-antigen ligase family protein n=1 Tax=Phyllobacterium salinisoli TaxID=1899321 RepID=A0A368K110_9HYPH|nr:O-antigen ligase [Phyllobacterium salinisoli]RCS22911.1 O-antigen ligase family protein [Phyllobacterium salinisoli]